MTAPHRVSEENARGQKFARYVAERADDYFFAECHDLLARAAGTASRMRGTTSTLRTD